MNDVISVEGIRKTLILFLSILILLLGILPIPFNLGLLGLQLNDYPRIFRA